MAPPSTSGTRVDVAEPDPPRAAVPAPLLALPALVLGASAIGVGPILVRVSEVGPCATAWWRMALALPLFAAWLLAERMAYRRRDPATSSASPLPAQARGGLLLAGVFFAIDLSLFHWGIVLTTVTNSTLLSNLAPIFVTFGAWWLFGERVSWGACGALVMALGGAALLVLGKDGHGAQAHGTHPLLGDGVSFIAAFAYAAYQLTVTRVRRQASTAEFMWWSCLACAGLVGLVALFSGERLLPATARGWWTLLALALIAQVIGQGLITWALKHLSQAFSTVALLVQPVVAAAIAWPLFGEALSGSQGAGAGILLLGICWSRLSTSRPPACPPAYPPACPPSCPPGPAAKHPA